MRPLISNDGIFLICVTLLIVLFAGDPDLMDAIIKHLGAS